MTTIIWIDGGLGRIITSIPALLKYHQNHLDEEWYVMIPQWDYMTLGFPELQERTFNPDTKGVFELFRKADRVITAEPYRVPAYYRNEISLREAFDVVINDTTDHSDLPEMQLRLSSQERRAANNVIQYVKDLYKKEKTIVLQPFGSTAILHQFSSGSSEICDDTLRSIPTEMIKYFVDNLSKDYNLIFMGMPELNGTKTFRPEPDPHMREWAAIIEASDYFIGCDSCGQHMRRSFNKPASVVIGGTHSINTTYDNFHIIERDVPFYSDGMRISHLQGNLSSRLNEKRIEFTQEEIEKEYQEIILRIERVSYS